MIYNGATGSINQSVRQMCSQYSVTTADENDDGLIDHITIADPK